MTTRPLLCIVTDRLRLARAQQRPLQEGCELVLRQVEGAVSAGVELVQIRERDLDARTLMQVVSAAVALARGSMTRVMVNDRVDVALTCGAAGVHLREASVSAADVHRIAPQLIVGRSVHTAAAAAAAGLVDYLIAGTVFPGGSKSARIQPIRMAGLGSIVQAAGATPVLAIGGIRVETIRGLAETGAAGVAAIGAFIPDHPIEDVRLTVQKSAAALRVAFDSSSTVT